MPRTPRKYNPWPAWILFAVALVFCAWPLAIGWRSPELSAIAQPSGPPDVQLAKWLHLGERILPIGLLRGLALGLWVAIALGLGRALRASTGFTLAASIVPLGGALILVSPFAPLVLTDVRALPLLASLALWLLAVDLALAGTDEPRWKRPLANFVIALALLYVDFPNAMLMAAGLLAVALIPHRDRHRIGLVETPLLGIGAGLAAAHWLGTAPMPWTLPLDRLPAALLITMSLGALVVGLLAQRPFRQALLTLVAVGATGCFLPLSVALSMTAMTLMAACVLTVNMRTNRSAAITTLALLIAGWVPSHIVLARAHWQLETRSEQLKSTLQAEIVRVAKEQPNVKPLAWIPQPGAFQAGYESRTRLGWSGSLDGDLMLALEPPFAETTSDLSAVFGERALLRWFEERRKHDSFAGQPVLLLTCTFDAQDELVIEPQTLPPFAGALESPPIPLASVQLQADPLGWTVSPPVPAHLLSGLRLRFGKQAAKGGLLVHFGHPLSADHDVQTAAFDLPGDTQSRLVPWTLVDQSSVALGPPLTSIQVIGGDLKHTLQAPELLLAPVFAYLIQPANRAQLELSRGSRQPAFELFLDPQWTRPRRFEMRLEIQMPSANGLMKTLELSARGATLNKPTGEITLGPANLGPADPALEAARRSWSEFVDSGLALRLEDAPPEGYSGSLQIRLLGPGQLPIAETLPIEVRFRATPP